MSFCFSRCPDIRIGCPVVLGTDARRGGRTVMSYPEAYFLINDAPRSALLITVKILPTLRQWQF